jgi:hypothetical protein
VICWTLTSTIDALEAKRAKAQRCVTLDVMRHGESFSAAGKVAYTAHLCRGLAVDVWPPVFEDYGGYTTACHISNVKHLPSFTFEANGSYDFIPHDDFVGLAMDAEVFCEGLCLRCIKENKADLLEACKDDTHAEL